MVIPTGVEAVIAKTLEKSFSTTITQVVSGLWLRRLSPSGRRERAAGETLRRLTNIDIQGQLRLSVLVRALPPKLSVANIERMLGGEVFRGLLQEHVSCRLLGMPDLAVSRVRENMKLAIQIELIDEPIDKGDLATFSVVLFDEIDRVVCKLVESAVSVHSKELEDARQSAIAQLLGANMDSITRHNSHLRNLLSLSERAALTEWESTYRVQVAVAHSYIEPPDFERKRKIPISSLFVSPEIVCDGDEDMAARIDTTELYERLNRTVLLGSPGGGKSTISNVLATKAAVVENSPVPFVIVLRNFAAQDISVLEYIEGQLSSRYQCAAPEGAVESLLISGRALVIFDGLDELIDTSRRRDITNRVELFSSRYPLAKILVTSRLVGYEEAALDPASFEKCEIKEFSDSSVEEYAEKWFALVDDVDANHAKVLADSFSRESEVVPDLRANPLMLALMCIIYRGQQWIPRNRPDMYEHCANLLFDKWDSSRHIYVELKARAHVDAAIKHLAFWMFTESMATQGVTEPRLMEEATSYLMPAFDHPVDAKAAAQEFVDFCRGRSWVLTEVGTTAEGDARFGFTHRTFMEYFAAYELTRRLDGPERIARALLPRVASAEWEVVAELAVQISNKHSRDGGARILAVLCADKRHRSIISRKNIFSFAMRCLGFIQVPVSFAAEIASSYVRSVVAFAAAGNTIDTMEPTSVPAETEEAIEKAVVSVLSSYLCEDHSSISKRIAIEMTLDLPRLMTAQSIGGSRPRGNLEHWDARRRELFEEFKDEILANDDDMVWFASWRHDLISFEDLIAGRPRSQRYPLQILFTDTSWTWVGGGWGEWGSFMPGRLLQSGADDWEGFPATREEVEWLGEFLDGRPLPWLASLPEGSMHNGRGFGGRILVDKLENNYGATLFLLLLIGIEIKSRQRNEGVASYDEDEDEDVSSARPTPYDFASLVDLLVQTRVSDSTLPQWIFDVVAKLPVRQRVLTESWIRGDASFVAVLAARGS